MVKYYFCNDDMCMISNHQQDTRQLGYPGKAVRQKMWKFNFKPTHIGLRML